MMRSNAERSTTRSLTTGIAVLEGAHVQLAGRGDLRAVRHAVDDDAARAADALATVVVERHRLLAGLEQLLVEDVEHLEERHVVADVVELVGVQLPLGVSVCLAPHVDGDLHL
jgi:hypothetical protein